MLSRHEFHLVFESPVTVRLFASCFRMDTRKTTIMNALFSLATRQDLRLGFVLTKHDETKIRKIQSMRSSLQILYSEKKGFAQYCKCFQYICFQTPLCWLFLVNASLVNTKSNWSDMKITWYVQKVFPLSAYALTQYNFCYQGKTLIIEGDS